MFISWRYPDCLHACAVFLETKTLKKSLVMGYNRLQHCPWKKCLINHGHINQKSDSSLSSSACYWSSTSNELGDTIRCWQLLKQRQGNNSDISWKAAAHYSASSKSPEDNEELLQKTKNKAGNIKKKSRVCLLFKHHCQSPVPLSSKRVLVLKLLREQWEPLWLEQFPRKPKCKKLLR